ncbi:DNA translocase FtsK [Actinobacillus indolicus]|nr:DNA translocase FtsK [Actinobacillus indolicus]VTU06252.1 DNA translocase FtsK [Actinobacillus indolicus]
MIERLKGKENLVKFVLLLSILFGAYLILAWASFSPLDNAWSSASSLTHSTLNKAGLLGAWLMDVLFSLFGKVAFVFPFGLTFTAAYALAMKLTEEMEWKHIALWLLSFSVLLVGLAGLVSVVLSNSAYYLSGGFVGGMLTDMLGSQIIVLVISVLLTAVGFYFCSGQIIIQLFNQLYHWVLEDKEENKTQEDAVDGQETSLSLDKTEETQEKSADSQLTDLSIFSRPNITGLKTTVQEEFIEIPIQPLGEKENLTDISMFKVESSTPLPTVRVAENAVIPPITVESPAVLAEEEMPVEIDKPVMPSIRLNPIESIKDDPSPLSVNKSVSRVEEPVSVNVETVKTEVKEPSFVQKMTGNPPLVDEIAPVKTSVAVAQAEKTEPKVTPAYPKGYGETLIHPLLQTKKQVEKPTTPLPTIDLLTAGKAEEQQITEQEILETSARIEQELANFGVKATVEDVLVGPVVTRYEIKPAAGVKAAKITNLASDLARSLIFEAIRITDVVPGKPFMGIETPNRHRETVWLRDVLDSNAFRDSRATLPMALGKDISGKPIVVDMAKMPHLLVAGQTGGGKSVGVNTMILSLLFKLTPEQVRFIMIDPKVVELSIYNDIPHLLTPVVTDMKKAENALRWAVEEMERRYLLVSSLNVRNIEGFNAKIDQAAEMNLPIPNPLWRPGDSMDQLPPPLEKLTYIVLIVDEFADLMMSAGKQVEDHIMRIAQKARAVGIHLILATQRPSTDVITGVIKANIPSRIAFTVASQIDSRTILDKGGAEALLGRGDMLYSGAGSPDIIRIHGAFMTDDDVQRVADNWRARGKPEYIESIVTSPDGDENGDGYERSGGDLDPLFDEIAQFMIDGGATSISGVQRRFSLGFNRAARIIDQLEEQGILSAPDSRGKREVLAR